MNQKLFHDNHFDSIQALRGIMALFILLEHVRFLFCGAFGVDVFFCISGFMIMFSSYKSTDYFMRKRLIRILPLYYLMTVGTFLLLLLFPSMFEQTKANPVFLIKSLCFVPFDVGNGVLQPILRIGWTVNCEMFFYFIFFIAMKISFRYRGAVCSAFLGIVVLIRYVSGLEVPFLKFYGDGVMLDFILGISCYYIVRWLYETHQKKPFSKVISGIAMLVFAVVLIGLTMTRKEIDIVGLRRPLTWGLAAMVLVISAFLIGLNVKIPKFFVFLGNISFSLYLMHYYPVMLLDRKVFDFSVATPKAVIGVFISVALCIAVAAISWFVMEKKFGNLLRKVCLPSKKN